MNAAELIRAQNASKGTETKRKAQAPATGSAKFPAIGRQGSPHVLIIGGEDHELRLPFITALQDQGLAVTSAGTGSPEPFVQAGIAYHGFAFERFVAPLADWRALKAIRDLVEAVDPDVVQCFDTKLNILVPIALENVQRGTNGRPGIVRTINGRGWLYASPKLQARLLRPIYRALHRRAAKSTRAEVFEHDEDMGFFADGEMIGQGGGMIIPGAGIDVVGFERKRADGATREALREELGVGQAPVVMTVTRLTREKGIGTLLGAAAEVHRTHPDVRFVLVGPRESEGPLAITEKEIARHAPYVIAIGPRNDVPSLLSIADVFAFPSQYREGIPRALCEAGLAHVPIVTSDMPGCRAVISDGWNGRVVPTGNVPRLAASIRELLDNRATALIMAQRGSAPVREAFSLNAIVAGYASLYRAVANTSFGTVMATNRERREAAP